MAESPTVLSRTVTPDYVSVREAAVLLAVDRDTIYAMVRRGELPAKRLSTGTLRIPIRALRELPWVHQEE